MASKRKLEVPSAIVYGSSVPWLHPLLHEATNAAVCEDDIEGFSRDPTLAAFDDDDIVWETAKVAYLLYHNLSPETTLYETLRAIGVARDTDEHKAWVKKLAQKQTAWRNTILHKNLHAHVEEVKRKWLVANAWKTFAALPDEERETIWRDAYDADPKGIAISILRPIIGVLQIPNVFQRDQDDEEDQFKMRMVRDMLREKILFGCETVYKYRIMTNKKVRSLSPSIVAYLTM